MRKKKFVIIYDKDGKEISKGLMIFKNRSFITVKDKYNESYKLSDIVYEIRRINEKRSNYTRSNFCNN